MGTILGTVQLGEYRWKTGKTVSTPFKELLQNLRDWLEAYPEVWIKAYPEMESFLRGLYLVIVFNTVVGNQEKFLQFEARYFLQGYRQKVLEHPWILKDTKEKKLYLRRLRRKADNARLEPLERLLEVVSHTIEPRFSYLNMDFIQHLKQDALVNQEMTSLSKASIKIRLRERPDR